MANPSEPVSQNTQEVDPDADKIICFCHNVTLGMLKTAIKSGATTHSKIQAETCASTGCGGCEWEVLEILDVELKKLDKS